MHVSTVANFTLTEINNIFKCLGGIDELKVNTLREREYLENIQDRTRGLGVQKSMKLNVCIFHWSPRIFGSAAYSVKA